MRLGYRAVSVSAMAGLAVLAITLASGPRTEPLPPALAAAAAWSPAALQAPEPSRLPLAAPASLSPPPRADAALPPRLADAVPDRAPPPADPPVTIWSREIAPGETLDTVLAQAGLAASDRAEVALALGAEYDLRRLRPGHAVTVELGFDGRPRRVELAVEEGVRIEAVFGETLATRVIEPDPETVILAGEAVVTSSIFAAVDQAGIPARFAVDLSQMLGGTVDFRRELSGGETIRLMWREKRLGGETIGQPELTYAALDLGGRLYEVVWPDDGSGGATIFADGEVLRVFAQPVAGARLSSVFGRRKHPVYGNVRMHTGVDFAAPYGTPVRATAPGRVSFVGRRGGYGRVVEIAHGPHTVTRYAHLSAVAKGLAVGKRVLAGDVIGRVGATGTATGPNLHYEVLVNGRPTDPLSDERLAEAAEAQADDTGERQRLLAARTEFAKRLVADRATSPTERL
jgi:murein DD-endopeptidase MepM/ murein hydrolase activator NlpD